MKLIDADKFKQQIDTITVGNNLYVKKACYTICLTGGLLRMIWKRLWIGFSIKRMRNSVKRRTGDKKGLRKLLKL